MMLLVLGCLFASALAAPALFNRQPTYQQQYQDPYQQQYKQPVQVYTGQPQVPIVSETNEINPDGSFSYGYVSGDGQQVQAQGYLKNSGQKGNEAESMQGSYSYTAPDGTPITVNWIADEFGFRAEGAHLPTPPPIPVEIQKSLDLIARTQAQPQQTQPQYTTTNQYSSNYYQNQGKYRF